MDGGTREGERVGDKGREGKGVDKGREGSGQRKERGAEGQRMGQRLENGGRREKVKF